ncbi:MAG TPA: hypothetical protein VEW45_03880 [Candidatus Dormibacteraeota bacterium]|nr:hypothetical protein [Candidatus Dormibacteraeota bacterium]
MKDATIDIPSVQGVAINPGYTGIISQAAGNSLTVGAAGFAQAAATFVGEPTATLTVTGAFTLSGGTFSHNGGTVAFSTSNVTIDVGGTLNLNNVSFLSGTKTIAAGNTLVVLGTLNLAGGTINTGTLAAQGNIDVQLGFTGGGTATLLIDGAAPQTLTGFHTPGAGALPNVNIAKPPLVTLTISGTLRTARNWTYTSGDLAAAGSTLVFNGNLTVSGTHTLNNVELRSGTVVIAGGTTLNVPGTLTMTAGTLNSGTLAAQGNITVALGYTGSGTTTLLIDGAAPQTLTGFHTPGAGALPNVNIAKPPLVTLTISGTLRTARNWTYTSGDVAATGSTVVFNGNPTITGNHTLNNVEIRAGTVTIAAGTTLTASGTLELFSGTLNTGTLAAQADIFARLGFTGGGTATLLINGAGAQLFDGDHTLLAGSLPNVDIAKLSGVLTLTDILRTGRNWTHTASSGLVVTGTTLVFTGAAGQTITGNHTLNVVEIRGGTVTIAAGTTLTASGTLELFSGTLNTGTLAAQADIFARLGFTGGGTATLLINGAGPQTMNGFHTPGAGAMPNVDIAKPSGTLTIAGTLRTGRNWIYTSGGLVVAGSTLVFNGNLTISGDHTLNNVELRSGNVTVTMGDTLTVGGLLTLTNGNLEGGTIEALSDIVLLDTFDGETGTILIAGVGDQTLTGSATVTAGDVAHIVINKPSGTLFLVGTIRLLTSSWTWLNGIVDAGTSLVVFDTGTGIDAAGMTFADVQVTAGTATLLSDLNVAGDLWVSGGTLDAAEMTVTVAGNVTIDGSISPGTGLLVMNGTAVQTLGGAAAVIGLYDFTVDNAAGVTMSAPVSVAGTLTLNGPLNFSGTMLSIANPIAGTPTNLSGDATSSLVVTGSASGIVVPSSLPILLNLATDNPNGFALAAPLTVGGTLSLAGGIVDATAGTLTIGPSGSVVRTSGHVHGFLEQWVPLGSGVGVTFHVGDATRYAPASLQFGTVSTSGTITARTTPGEHPSIATSGIDPTQDVNRWWSLTNAGTVFDSVDVTLTFDPADVDFWAQPAAFVVGKWDGAWTLPAASGQTLISITASGMTSLSEFAVGELAGVPPSPTPTPSASPTPSPSPGVSGLPNTTTQPGLGAGSPTMMLILAIAMVLLVVANNAARRPMQRG